MLTLGSLFGLEAGQVQAFQACGIEASKPVPADEWIFAVFPSVEYAASKTQRGLPNVLPYWCLTGALCKWIFFSQWWKQRAGLFQIIQPVKTSLMWLNSKYLYSFSPTF